MKKHVKLFAFVFFAFFLMSTPVFAREMTIEELGTEAVNLKQDTQYVYVIGKYAFTSVHELTQQDIMLASRSIEATEDDGYTGKENIYNKMNIQTIVPEYGNNFEITGWKNDKNLVGNGQLPTDKKFDIRYIDYEFYAEKSETKINIDVDDEKYSTYNDTLKEKLKFETKDFYGKEKLTLKDGKLSGLLLKNNKVSLSPEDKKKYEDANYFFAYVLEVPNANENVTIKVTNLNGTNTITWNSFDVKSSEDGKTPGVVILVPVNKTKWETEQNAKTMTIVVDADGEKGKEYAPTTYTIDLSGLTFQGDSKADLKLGEASIKDKEILDKWGYKSELNEGLELGADGKLKGKLVEQDLISGEAFGEGNKDGYYFDFTFKLPDDIDLSKIRISQLTEKNTNIIKKTFQEKEYDENGDLTILFRFGPETEKGSMLYYSVDLDGEGEEYLPTIYTIDYTEVTFVKESKFTITGVDKQDADEDNITSWDGWSEGEGYKTNFQVVENDPHKVKVTGLLPIFNREDFTDGSKFPEKALYYLAFKLQTELETKTSSTINVEFIQDDNKTLQQDNFKEEKNLYVLKYLDNTDTDGSEISPNKKKFDITLDWDGDGEHYAPYTITVDWSELKLQNYSVGNFGNYEVATQDNIKEDEKAVQDLGNYGYNFDTSADVKVKTEFQEETEHAAKKGLEGKIKEQTLTKGTFDDDTGYFVPIKVEFPGKGDDSLSEYSHTWTITLNTENGTPKTYTPTPEEYEQGWVLVLFKIEKDGSDKTIRYKIDFDGDEFACIPEEYTISYENLEFETENKITYKYKDNEGKDQTEDVVVYENEIVNLKDLSELDTDYRTFDGWYDKESKNVSEEKEFKTKADEDVELIAHWNLNVEKFMEDVIADLKNPDSTYSKDFSGQFELEQKADNKNEITIKVESPNVKLSTLAETSIPGTIAYILQKGEIKDVTLTVGDSTTIFKNEGVAGVGAVGAQANEDSVLDETGKALKGKIIEDAKATFNTELEKSSGTEADATMDQVEFEGTSFKLKIGDPTDNTIKLVDAKGTDLAEGKETYTFKFNSKFAVVDSNDQLGPDTIKEALDKNNYDTIYIDGDLTEEETIEITTEKDVTIEPVENASKEKGLMTVDEEPKHTITVNNKDYAIDVQSTGEGTITISDLKITGGKKAELKIEDKTNVKVDNIDVSGNITQATSREEEMNASIIVKGNLTASNVENSNESYVLPTIAVITGYAHPDSKDPEHAESGPTNHLATNATVKVDNMTMNGTYCLVDKTNQKFNSSKETYYGSFYYNDKNNSQIYFMGVIDTEQDAYPYDAIQIYYYNDIIDISQIGYKPNTEPATDNKVFTHFYMDNDTNNKIEDNTQLAQNKLKAHTTTVAHAVYGTKPVSALNFEQVSGLLTNGNKISGTLSTQSEDGKFTIPVTLTSEKFQDNISTVKVTNPNGKTETYTYSSNSNNGIATVSNANTMKLQLEAIKSSKITGNKGKVYEITVDVDGKEKDEYQQETYTVDYNDVKTLEEKINQAAKATLEANSFTVTKNNKINGYTEEFTYKYNAKDGLTYLKAEKDNVEEYTFSVKYAGVAENSSKLSVVARKKIENEEDSGVYLNDWVYVHPQQVGRAIQEVSMLTDVMKDGKTSINAIDKVSLVDESAHKYKVELNRDKYNDWVTNNYLSNSKYSSAEWALKETVTVYVELDDSEQYIKSIKTSQTSSNNTFDVTFKDVNKTTIKVPTEFFEKEGITLTNEDIKKFYEDGAKWWDKHIHEDAYKQ